ncbi:dGTP triphosphohydrolase [Listeria floridensis]|uniref:dGTP triphosphohydrolase n=1 Tax=Listeria floridensis TaxID=1494962 RepID=UPI0004B1C1B4|nr:dNTP triphosphohydrolase [Listeria floridensis]
MMNWNDLLSTTRTNSKNRFKSSNDIRNAFENDYQRIIISASFRRLQDKTQVFPLDKNDFIRTRLTHSIEVSQIAKSLGAKVGSDIVENKIDSTFTESHIKTLSDLLACAGLLHDMGNPPFGHFGECAIRQWFAQNMNKIQFDGSTLKVTLDTQMQEDFLHFDGNAQVIRLITKLHQLYEGMQGMNLTCATVNTLLKYPIPSSEVNKEDSNVKYKKMGYFSAEKDTFKMITQETGTLNYRHPATFLLEAADDISYLLADLEDGMKKKPYKLRTIT